MHLAQSACMTLVPKTLILYISWRRLATLEVASSILAWRDRALGVVVLRREGFAILVVLWPDASVNFASSWYLMTLHNYDMTPFIDIKVWR